MSHRQKLVVLGTFVGATALASSLSAQTLNEPKFFV